MFPLRIPEISTEDINTRERFEANLIALGGERLDTRRVDAAGPIQ